jgi:hypothetical protein
MTIVPNFTSYITYLTIVSKETMQRAHPMLLCLQIIPQNPSRNYKIKPKRTFAAYYCNEKF